jgi:hypothetical protein
MAQMLAMVSHTRSLRVDSLRRHIVQAFSRYAGAGADKVRPRDQSYTAKTIGLEIPAMLLACAVKCVAGPNPHGIGGSDWVCPERKSQEEVLSTLFTLQRAGAQCCKEATQEVGQCICLVLTHSKSEAGRAAVGGVWPARDSQ